MTPSPVRRLLTCCASGLAAAFLALPARTTALGAQQSTSNNEAITGAAPAPLFGPGERILFQGDSITDMKRGRDADPNHILGHSYAFLIATRHGASYPERKLVFINRGISGNTVGDLAKRWRNDTLDEKPDVLSVLIGINDIVLSFKNRKPYDLSDIEATYDTLLRDALAANPKLRIILGEPFALPGAHTRENAEACSKALSEFRAMTARLAERHQTALARYQQVFDEAVTRAPVEHWIWDGIHPTYSGQHLLAEEWERAYAERYTPAAPSASENSALVPSPKLEQDSYDWYARHFAVLELQKRMKADLVLIGDSITHFWGGEPGTRKGNGPLAWEKAFARRKVLNMGFGWDRTQNVLWRLEHGQLDGQTPKTIILNIGTNNLTGTKNARTNTPAEIAEAIVLICRKLQAKSPGSRIVVMGVLPRGFEPDAPLRPAIRELNALLPAALNASPQVTFLDISARFLSPDGSFAKDLMPDSTHPSDKGYDLWAQALIEAGVLE